MSPADRSQLRLPSEEPAGAAQSAPLTVWHVLEAIFNLFALNILLLLACLTVVGAPLALRAATVAIDRWRRDGDDRLIRSFCVSVRTGPWVTPWVTIAVPMAGVAIATEEVRFFYRRLDVMSGLCTGLGAIGVIVALAVVGYVIVLSARDDRLPAAEAWQRSLRLAGARLARTTVPVIAVLGGAAYLLMADPSLTVIGLPLAALCASRRLIDQAPLPEPGIVRPDSAVPDLTAKEVNAR